MVLIQKKRVNAAWDGQRKKTDLHRKSMDIKVGSWVLTKFHLERNWLGLVRRGELSPKYMYPLEVFRRIDEMLMS